jgi:muramoyltetrapeptide carboxypeptidase
VEPAGNGAYSGADMRAPVAGKMIKPRALRPGDTIGIVAVAAAVDAERLEHGAAALREQGYHVKLSPHALDRDGILSGSDAVRAAEVKAFFQDPEVRAIFCARGGYGCGRLLPLLDLAELARTPKILLGFSDATFLLNALTARADLVSFHGPMVAMDFARGLSPRSLSHLRRLLGGSCGIELEAPEVIRPGCAEGPLVGGCLSVMAAMLATPWQPSFEGRILFLEDTGEKAYRIDRMLVQLRQAGVFDAVAGIVFGALRPVDHNEQERALIAHFVAEQTNGLKCPVLCGIAAGHGTENLILPLGVRVRVDSDRRCMTISEQAVTLHGM